MMMFTLVCKFTEESQEVYVCQAHGDDMPLINDQTVLAEPCDDDIECEFCVNSL